MGMRRAGRIAAAVLLATALLTWAGSASAKTGTLGRGAMNLIGTPLDIALVRAEVLPREQPVAACQGDAHPVGGRRIRHLLRGIDRGGRVHAAHRRPA